nr:hypothetical protein Iba_chr01aCG9880 [Ipomoea batatas]
MKLFLGVRVLGFFSGGHPPQLLSLIWSLLGPDGSRRCSAASTRRKSAGKGKLFLRQWFSLRLVLHPPWKRSVCLGGLVNKRKSRIVVELVELHLPRLLCFPCSGSSGASSSSRYSDCSVFPCSGSSGASSSSTVISYFYPFRVAKKCFYPLRSIGR